MVNGHKRVRGEQEMQDISKYMKEHLEVYALLNAWITRMKTLLKWSISNKCRGEVQREHMPN